MTASEREAINLRNEKMIDALTEEQRNELVFHLISLINDSPEIKCTLRKDELSEDVLLLCTLA